MKYRAFLGALLCAALMPSLVSADDVATRADTVYRDYNVIGNAASGVWNPPKPDIRSLWHLQNSINTTQGLNINAFINVGETTIDAALTRADAALAAQGGGLLHFPAQSTCYVLAAKHTITAGNITYQGDGGNSSCIQANFDDDALSFGDGTANPEGMHVNGLRFQSTIPIASRTKGAFIRFRNTYNSGASDIICRDGQYVCIDVDGGSNQWTTRLKNIFMFTGHSGIRIGNAGGIAQETFIDNAAFAGQTVAGLELINAGGLYTSHSSAVANYVGVLAHPGTGQQVSGWLATDDLWDSQYSHGAYLHSTGGLISQISWKGVWIATCGQAVGSAMTQDVTASCLRIEGAANQVFGLRFAGMQVYNAVRNCVLIAGGADIHFEGRSTICSTLTVNTYDNILVSSNVSNFVLKGRFGGVLSSGVVGSPIPNPAPLAVHVQAGTSNNYTIECDCSGNSVGGVVDDAAGSNRRIHDTSGVSTNIETGTVTHTGTETFPTAAVDTNTQQAASTAFVLGQAASATPPMDGAAAAGTSTRYARADHVHPTDTSRAALASPTFTGTPAAATAAVDTNTTQLATTAFVLGQAASATPLVDGTAAAGTSTRYARADHVHPAPASSALSDSGAWTSTGAMTVTCATGSGFTITASGAYKQIMAKTIAIRFIVTVTTAGTCNTPTITLPFTAAGGGVMTAREFTGTGANANKMGAASISAGLNTTNLSIYDGSNAGAVSGEAFAVSGVFEAQ